jgi:hypothetical protein
MDQERVRAEMEVEEREKGNTTNNAGYMQNIRNICTTRSHYCAGSRTSRAKKRARVAQTPGAYKCTCTCTHFIDL